MLFQDLENINSRPKPFSVYTAEALWTDDHTSKQMLSFHLDESIDLSSRNTLFIQQSVDWMSSRLNLAPGMQVADFGCGPGLYATRLAQKGLRVTGIDFSKRSLRYAQEMAERNHLSIDYVHQNYLEFTSAERFDLIIMIFCDFCALSPDQRKVMLKTFYEVLKPGGHVLLDVFSLAGFDQREELAKYEFNHLQGFWAPHRYYGFHNVFKYEIEKVVLDKHTIVEPDRTRVIYNWLQYFSQDSISREFLESGFKIMDIYSDVAGKPFDSESTEFALIAQR